MVLGFESKVPLDEDEEPARLAARVEPDPRDVLDDRLELALRVCFLWYLNRVSSLAHTQAKW